MFFLTLYALLNFPYTSAHVTLRHRQKVATVGLELMMGGAHCHLIGPPDPLDPHNEIGVPDLGNDSILSSTNHRGDFLTRQAR